MQSALDVELLTGALTFDILPTDLLDISLGIGGGTIDYDASIVTEVDIRERLANGGFAPVTEE